MATGLQLISTSLSRLARAIPLEAKLTCDLSGRPFAHGLRTREEQDRDGGHGTMLTARTYLIVALAISQPACVVGGGYSSGGGGGWFIWPGGLLGLLFVVVVLFLLLRRRR
jgi:hypothetical protein